MTLCPCNPSTGFKEGRSLKLDIQQCPEELVKLQVQGVRSPDGDGDDADAAAAVYID